MLDLNYLDNLHYAKQMSHLVVAHFLSLPFLMLQSLTLLEVNLICDQNGYNGEIYKYKSRFPFQTDKVYLQVRMIPKYEESGTLV